MAKNQLYNPLDVINPMQYKGGIAVATDFPTLALVKAGWMYTVTADVTDNNATKTNTGQAFVAGDEIVWNGTNWTNIGGTLSGFLTLAQSPAQTVVNSPKFSFLTATRVPFVGTNGILQDSANLTFNGTTLTAGGFMTAGAVSVGTTTNTIYKLLVNSGTSVAVYNDIGIGGLAGWQTNEEHGISFVYSDTVAVNKIGTISMKFDGTKCNMYFKNFFNSANQSTTLMAILGNGNIGIGTPEPTTILDVWGTSTARAIVARGTITSGVSGTYSNMLPALTSGNWTVTGNTVVDSGTISKVSAPTAGTATPSSVGSPTIGVYYKVVIVCSASSGTHTYTYGGVAGTTITATTITDYIYATTTGNFILTSSFGGSLTITSVTITPISGSIVFKLQIPTSSSGVLNLNWSNGNKQRITLGENLTDINFTDPAESGGFTLIMVQDGTGSRTATGWDSNVKWANGVAPTLSTAIGAVDIISFIYDKDADVYYGMISQNFA